jgi:hypothetical protein
LASTYSWAVLSPDSPPLSSGIVWAFTFINRVENVMLKDDVLKILTVSEWAAFKKFVSDKPTPVWIDSDGVGHPDFLTHDIHEFLTIMDKINNKVESEVYEEQNSNQAGSHAEGHEQVVSVPDGGSPKV